MIGSTTYGPGSVTTATNVGPLPQGANLQGIYDLFRRMTRAQQPQQPASGGLLAARPAAAPRWGGGGTMAPATEQPAKTGLDLAREQAEIAQLRALSQPPPMRMTTFGGNAINGYIPDTNAMTGAQRQVFLPNNAAFTE